MKRYILTKSQVKKLKLAESKNLLLEGDMNTLISEAQEGDIIYVEREEGSGNKSFKVKEIRNDSIIAQALFGKKSYVQISEASAESDEGSFMFVNIYTADGKKISGGNTVRIGAKNIYLVRDNSPIETVSVSEPSSGDSDEGVDKNKTSKVEQRAGEVEDLIKNASEGDILTITTGKMNEDGEIDRSTMTNIKFKVTEKPDQSEIIAKFQEADGENESKYTDLKKYDSIRINTWSIKVNPENVDKLDVVLTITHGGETANYKISDVVIFDIESGGDEESEEDKEEDVVDDLSDEQIKRLKNNPKVEKALRLGMELDDIIQKLRANKKGKGRKGRDKCLFKPNSKLAYKWVSQYSVGEDEFELKEGEVKEGVYKCDKNRIITHIPQRETEKGGKIYVYLENLKKTDEKGIYNVTVKAKLTKGKGEVTDLLEEPKEGQIKITDKLN